MYIKQYLALSKNYVNVVVNIIKDKQSKRTFICIQVFVPTGEKESLSICLSELFLSSSILLDYIKSSS